MKEWRTEKIIPEREYSIQQAATALNASYETVSSWVARGWLVPIPGNSATFTGQAIKQAVRNRNLGVFTRAKRNRGRRTNSVTKINIE